jgi:DNA-binding PadR family transcriptional regulator
MYNNRFTLSEGITPEDLNGVLTDMVKQGLVELSVDEEGEFIFYCTDDQKRSLEDMLE